MENKPLFMAVTTAQYNQSKETGTWPLATITAIRSDYPDSSGFAPVYFLETVVDPSLPWVTKQTDHKEDDILDREVSDIKSALWSVVDVLHQHNLTIMEPGTHVMGFDEGTPEKVAGAVASWSHNSKFAQYAPTDGWREIIWRNGHYVGGAQLGYEATTKHDYIDMLVSKSANFRINVPPFLGKYVETVVTALELSAEESRAKSHQNLVGWAIRRDVYQSAKTAVSNGNVPEVSAISVVKTDGTSVKLSDLKVGDVLYFYRLVDGEPCYQAYVTWDGSDMRRSLIAKNAGKGFLVSLNVTLS